MLINTHPHWDMCKLTYISACLVCRKFPCNKNDWNVLKLCHGYVMAWQVCTWSLYDLLSFTGYELHVWHICYIP